MKIEKFPSNITEELAEETGWHIGDGSRSYYKNQGGKKGKLYPRLEIKTISFPLASQLKENFNELGLRATMYKEKFVKKGGQKDSYAVVIRGVEMFDLFMKVVKPQNPKHSIKHLKFTQSFK